MKQFWDELLAVEEDRTQSYRMFHEKKLCHFLQHWIKENEAGQTGRALPFAAEKHDGQYRSGGTPYLIHPLTMAVHAVSLGVASDELLAVILLHDVCEDCGVAVQDLPVNDEVKAGVEAMTFSIRDGETKQQAKERYYEQLAFNRLGAVTKAFDRCNNISEMAQAFSVPRMERYIAETRNMVLPLIEKTAQRYVEYGPALFALKYQIVALTDSIAKIL